LRCAIKRHLPLPNGKRHTPCWRGGAAAKSRRESKEVQGIPNPNDGRMWGGMGETPKSGGTSLRCRRQRKRAL
jgi:hypothetical protein